MNDETRLQLSVLMISTDPGLLKEVGTGDVLARHRRYAERVKSLDIIVFGGSKQQSQQADPSFTIHATGTSGIANLWRAFRMARAIMKERGIGLIVTQDPHGTGYVGRRLKRKYGIPLIVHLHGDFWNNSHWERERWSHRLKAALQRGVVQSADAVRVVSEGIRRVLLASSVPEEKIRVINTPVNDVLFTTLTDEQKLFVEKLRFKHEKRFPIIFCGRLAPAKNLEFTLSVIFEMRKRRPDVLLFIVGDGEESQKLEKRIGELRLEQNVVLLGALSHDQTVAYYHLAKLLVLFSTNESFGKVIIEAGLSGIPALASRTTGASEIVVEGKTGFLVPINDLTASVDVLEEMIEYEEHTKWLGEQARVVYLERYSMQRSIDAIIALWKEIARV